MSENKSQESETPAAVAGAAPLLECDDCHCKGADVEETTCPYTEEIDNKVVPATLCKKCYHERCMDI